MTRRDFGKVAVLMGGPSAEREVSLKSGRAVLAALINGGVDAHGIDADRDVLKQLETGGYTRVFNALHGRWGEDGVIQGALEVLGLPYTGSGLLASALGMDKLLCKQIWRAAEVPTPEHVVLKTRDDLAQAWGLGFPLMVKPNREGSSLGISKVRTADELQKAWQQARQFDDAVFAERCIEGKELTAGILGKQVLPLIHIETPRDIYDYEAKYVLDTTRYHCPSRLDPALESVIQNIAREAFDLIGCSGWGRVDFMLDRTEKPYVLEVNTVPGMTDHSLVPKAAKQAGIAFDELVLRILETSDVAR